MKRKNVMEAAQLGGLVLLVTLATLSGCASTSPVMELAEGGFEVVAQGATESAARDEANRLAREHCDRLGHRAAIIDRRTDYTVRDSNTVRVELRFICK